MGNTTTIIGLLGYADDVVLLTESEGGIKEQTKNVLMVVKQIGLKMNENKTYNNMIIQRRELVDKVLEMNEYINSK